MAGLAHAVPLASCAHGFSTDELDDALTAAEAQFANQDADAFAGARTMVETRLGCLADPLTPVTIGRVHQSEALGAFLAHDEDKMVAALAGMLAGEKDHVIPDVLVPDGHKIRAALPRARGLLGTTKTESFRTLPAGWIEVDGVYSETVQVERAAILQYIDAQGKVQETRYYWPGADLLDWKADGKATKPLAVAPKVVAPPKQVKPRVNRPAPQRIAFAVGTGVAAVATGALVAVASSAHTEALDLTVPVNDAEAARELANATTWGYIGSAALTAGLGIALVVTW